MTAELAKARIDYEIVTAVDDRDLDLRDTEPFNPSYLTRSDFRPGRTGNGLSHLRVYQKILTGRLDRALVLEDDVTLSTELGSVVDALGEHMEGAEVALLNFDSRDTCELSVEGLVHLPSSRLLALPIDVNQPASAAAYVITREACKRMSENILPIRAHSDDWNFWYSQGAIDRVRCVTPLAVVKNPDFESTIQYYSPRSLKARLVEAITHHELPIIHRAVSYRRQHIWRKWTRVEFADKPFVQKPSRLE